MTRSTFHSSLDHVDCDYVADTSVIINLINSMRTELILRILPGQVSLTHQVQAEIEKGRPNDRKEPDLLNDLISKHAFFPKELGPKGQTVLERLTIGSSEVSLGDGEASTIAKAYEDSNVAVIDDVKATKVCQAFFPSVRVATSIDLLLHQNMCNRIEREELADIVYNALRNARMFVPAKYYSRVVNLIGLERAKHCDSLPSAIRSVHKK